MPERNEKENNEIEMKAMDLILSFETFFLYGN